MKKIALVLIGIVAVTGTFFLDQMSLKTALILPGHEALSVLSGTFDIQESSGRYDIYNTSDQTAALKIGRGTIIRVTPKTNLQAALTITGPVVENINITLVAGRLWVNTINSSVAFHLVPIAAKTELKFDALDGGVFDIELEKNTFTATVFRRTALVDVSGTQLIIPQGKTITFGLDKIAKNSTTIGQLRYAKLAKEFPLIPLDSSDTWTMVMRSQDSEFANQYKQELFQELRVSQSGAPSRSQNQSILDTGFGVIDDLVDVVTFDEDKVFERRVKRAVKDLNKAINALYLDEKEVASLAFERFKQTVGGSIQKQQMPVLLRDRLDRFSFVSPLDPLYGVKTVLRGIIEYSSEEKLLVFFHAVLDAQISGYDAQTQSRVSGLLTQFAAVVKQEVPRVNAQKSSILQLLAAAYNSFLYENLSFLSEDFLRIGEMIESAYLSRISSKEAQVDYRQFLISDKNTGIARIRQAVDSATIGFQSGRRAILFLASRIDTLKPTYSETAFFPYFEEQLKESGPFISFLRSAAAQKTDAGFKESFAEYQKEIAEAQKIRQLLATSSGGEEIPSFRREQLISFAASDLYGVGLTDIQVQLSESETSSQMKIVQSTFEDKKFGGYYDVDKKLFTDIEFGGQKIENGIRLKNIKDFLLVRSGKLILKQGATEEAFFEPPDQSAIQKVVRTQLFEQLSKLQIAVEDRYLGLEDVDQDIIHIRLAVLGEGVDAKVFSFDLSQKMSVVTNLKVQTVAGEIPVNDTFSLRELPIKVTQIFERAIFEKQKEDELKKMLEEGQQTPSEDEQEPE